MPTPQAVETTPAPPPSPPLESFRVAARTIGNAARDELAAANDGKPKRRFTVVFATAEPYPREWGSEQIDLAGIDLSRLNAGAPVLFNHDRDQPIGYVRKAWIAGDEARAEIELNDDPGQSGNALGGRWARERIVDKTISGVSWGYEVISHILTPAPAFSQTRVFENGEIHSDEFGTLDRVTESAAREISLAVIQAAPNGKIQQAQHKRSAKMTDPNLNTNPANPNPAAAPVDDPNRITAAESNARIAAAVQGVMNSEAQKALVARMLESQVETCRLPGGKKVDLIRLAHQLLRGESMVDGKVVAVDDKGEVDLDVVVSEFETRIRKASADSMRDDPESIDGGVGLSVKEQERFSFRKWLGFATGQIAAKDAGLEVESVRAACAAMGLSEEEAANRCPLPYDMIVSPRTAAARHIRRTAAAGGNATTYANADDLIADIHMGGRLIEYLRDRAAVLGARYSVEMYPAPAGTHTIPRSTNDPAIAWNAEGVDAVESVLEFDDIKLEIHTASTAVEATFRLLRNASPEFEAIAMRKIAAMAALAIDNAVLSGTGSNGQPKGILATTGRQVVDFGANSAAPTWEKILAFETLLETANIDASRASWFMNPTRRTQLETTPIQSGDPKMILDRLREPMMAGGAASLLGYPLLRKTSAIGSNIIFVPLEHVFLPIWNLVDIRVDETSKAASRGRIYRAFTDLDVAVAYPKAVVVGSNS